MQTAALNKPTGNTLLDSLPDDEFQRIQSGLKRVLLTAGQVLSVQGEHVGEVYFPKTGLISCRANGTEGESIEIYAVGREGLAEPAAILTGVAAVTCEVQISGEAYRISIEDLCVALRETMELPQVLLKFAYSLAVRMVQATKCAMFHSVKQRAVLWLLLAHRAHGQMIPCTHQSIADALGARRASVTVVLDELASQQIIERQRGRITIRNCSQLEALSCDCYKLIKDGTEPELECDLVSNTPERQAS